MERRRRQDPGWTIGRLRGFRNAPEQDESIGAVVGGLHRDLERQQRRQAGVAEAWASLVPPEIRAKAFVQGVEGGVLRVCVADSATRYLFDRWLRAGGERALIAQAAASIRSVRVRVQPC